MAVGGFTNAAGGADFEAKITPIVIISCIMAATGGLMFGYDVGVSGNHLFFSLSLYIYMCVLSFFYNSLTLFVFFFTISNTYI